MNAPHSALRRLLERFAFIAFALYHVPLFLNNYPSLGGGGFNETGLAVRWGHVFTPAGVWVAKHLFHLTGPMPDAYSGDNGDVGEEFGRLLVAVVIALVAAAGWTVADRKQPRGWWVEDTFRVMLRYSIALGLASYAVAKILPMQFPPLDTFALEQRLGDLTPMGLLWRFMEYSRPYAFFGGVMEMAVVLLLCFRRTATLGALICLAVMTNVTLLNYAYGVQVKLYSTMIVLSAAVLVLYDLPRLLAVFVRNQPTPAAALSSPLTERIPVPLRWTIKTLLVGSVITSSFVAMVPAIRAQAAPTSPIDGTWMVTTFARDGHALDSTGDPARWRRLIVDKNRIAVRLESDALIGCRRTPPTDSTVLAFGCNQNRLAQLRWTRTGDVLQLDGTFANATLSMSARHMEYPLRRGRFRWIYDR